MYAYISGLITMRSPTMVVIESGGVGYELQISLHTYGRIEQMEKVRLWTQLIVSDYGHTLFGFFDPEERTLFNHLISVSGIGPNTARLILSGMAPRDVEAAIISEDDVSFNRVKGVGPKTARRLIVDLKDKIAKGGGSVAQGTMSQGSKARQEAIAALISLGYPAAQAQKAVNTIGDRIGDNDQAEQWIKAALRQLAG